MFSWFFENERILAKLEAIWVEKNQTTEYFFAWVGGVRDKLESSSLP